MSIGQPCISHAEKMEDTIHTNIEVVKRGPRRTKTIIYNVNSIETSRLDTPRNPRALVGIKLGNTQPE